jgi:zinc transporter
MTTDPALALDADDRQTLGMATQHVTRHLNGLEEYRTRVQMLEDQVEAQRSETMTRSSLNLTIVATVFFAADLHQRPAGDERRWNPRPT